MDLREIFHAVCENAQQSEGKYLCLMARVPYYGGPEEGGWWGEDHIVESYQFCENQVILDKILTEINELVRKENEETKTAYNRFCSDEWERDDSDGPDSLAVLNGPSELFIEIQDNVPQSRYGNRYYE